MTEQARKAAPRVRCIIIKESPTFWEVRPPTKRNMQILLEYILMHCHFPSRELQGAPPSREEFERWAAEAFGGDISRFTKRQTGFPDEYVAADLEWAWRAYQQGVASRDRELREMREALQGLMRSVEKNGEKHWTVADQFNLARAYEKAVKAVARAERVTKGEQ